MRRAVVMAMALMLGAGCSANGQSGSESERKPDSAEPTAGSVASLPDSGVASGGRPSTTPPPDDGALSPGEEVSDRGQKGSGACAGVSVGELIATIVAAHPELADIQQLHDAAIATDGSFIYAYQRDDGGFSFAWKRGDGDCEAGCIDNEYWYFATDERCAPEQVGHYKPGISPEGCIVEDGAPMFGRPPQNDPLHVCGGGSEATDISGSYRFKAVGTREPCSLSGQSPAAQDVELELSIELAQSADDLRTGTATLHGAGNAAIDDRELAAQFVRRRFDVSETEQGADGACLMTHSLSLSYDFEGFAPGMLRLEEVDTPDCAKPGDYCKGQLTLSLELIE